jgi:hypothetical protein
MQISRIQLKIYCYVLFHNAPSRRYNNYKVGQFVSYKKTCREFKAKLSLYTLIRLELF